MNNRLMEETENSHGTKMKIISYRGSHNIDVEFENGYIIYDTTYANFKNKSLKSPKCKTVYGVGYLDACSPKENKKSYMYWKNMMVRCYDNEYKNKKPSYINCTSSEEWHSFKNFTEWFNINYYNVKDEIMHLDKDILGSSGVYSKETCIFVPHRINMLFQKNMEKISKLPKGISMGGNKYRVRVHNLKSISVGTYYNLNEATMRYKESKLKVIKDVANDYREFLPINVYNILINYKIS